MVLIDFHDLDELKNRNEEKVWAAIEAHLAATPGACRCRDCVLDTAAIALNRLPPRYQVFSADLGQIRKELCGDEAEIPDMNTGEIKKEIRYECSSAKSEQSNLAYYKHEAGHLMNSWFAMGAQTVLFTLLTIIVQVRKKAGRE